MNRTLAACIAALILLGCENPLTNGLRTEPSLLIVGSESGVASGFAFLPPLARQPRHSGAFDASLAPSVEICAVSGSTCRTVVTFTTAGGRGAERVRVDTDEEHYIVNWHTGEFDLELRRTYRIRVLVLTTLLGHVDVVLAANEREARSLETGGAIGVVRGRTLPIRFRIEEGAVYVVAPPAPGEMVEVESLDRTVTLSIPAGALEEPIALTITPVVPPGAESEKLVGGTVYHFGPSGTRFGAPVTVSIAYDPARRPRSRAEESLRLGTLVDGRWEFVPGSRVNPATRRVEAELEHFSVYSVMAARRIAVSVHRNRIPEIHMVYENGDYAGRFARYATNPAWSPDGTRLAFIQYDSLDFIDGEISIGAAGPIAIAPVAGGPKYTLPNAFTYSWARIRWSPDGARLLYDRNTGLLAVVNADGSGEPTVLPPPDPYPWAATPDWSPDGTRIAFSGGSHALDFHIFTMNADGTNIRKVASGSGGEVWSPLWAPDGSRLYFVWHQNPGPFGPHEIRSVHLTSGHVTTVLANLFGAYSLSLGFPYFFMLDLLPERTRFTVYSYGPSWPPDFDGQGNWAYWTASLDGTDLRRAYSDEQLVAALGGAGTTWLMNNESWEP